eukprot:4387357-Amphidinium_carterae.1
MEPVQASCNSDLNTQKTLRAVSDASKRTLTDPLVWTLDYSCAEKRTCLSSLQSPVDAVSETLQLILAYCTMGVGVGVDTSPYFPQVARLDEYSRQLGQSLKDTQTDLKRVMKRMDPKGAATRLPPEEAPSADLVALEEWERQQAEAESQRAQPQ